MILTDRYNAGVLDNPPLNWNLKTPWLNKYNFPWFFHEHGNPVGSMVSSMLLNASLSSYTNFLHEFLSLLLEKTLINKNN